jgi:hypothetical protein
MEDEQMQRLHDVLSKLSRKGKAGGLGTGGGIISTKARDPTLPNNSLYARFVREGAGHKRTFDNDNEGDDSDSDRKSKHRRKKGEDCDDSAIQQLLPDLIKDTLKDQGRKQSKDLWKLICLQLDDKGHKGKDFKKAYKKTVNALVDSDDVEVDDDGNVEIVAAPVKEKKKKKEKKEKKIKKEKR